MWIFPKRRQAGWPVCLSGDSGLEESIWHVRLVLDPLLTPQASTRQVAKSGQAWRPSVPPVRPAPPRPGGNGRGSCAPDAATGAGRQLYQNGVPSFCVSARTGPIMVWPSALRSLRLHGQSGAAVIPRRRASGRPHQSEPNMMESTQHMRLVLDPFQTQTRASVPLQACQANSSLSGTAFLKLQSRKYLEIP